MSSVNPFLNSKNGVIIKRVIKNAMQSGKYKSEMWCVVQNEASNISLYSIMNWVGGSAVKSSQSLVFPDKITAIEYAKRNNFAYQIME